ncbi:efflux pump, RND family, membrane fusion protein [Syntrophotalea carbinolica DSM 2380]|uniref:Efflux pump, RND family, membrane fusion protein n=1 Tax=Syntrophotalea carbinolica (strain DSM 2380 / NBRC 103641 / GraBd1) TaxID=338963 RepID=Q3A0J5_SYNC1|nr:efflux RND transporter periplasmic adaptor subunit [Syntrophotalea carbinolica]ABA90112.1 efflux pump, RND family, membrane fusion protein [Syntrophotalea carbinolica DSM 2380]
MKGLPYQKRTLALVAVFVPLLGLFVYVALRSGPLAPVSVVLATVENKNISPALFGIGTVKARFTYKIGPTSPGRLKQLNVYVGDSVKSGQVLGEMDPVDLNARLQSMDAAIKRAKAQLGEAEVRHNFAQTQATRYEGLLKTRSTSEEIFATKQQDLLVAGAALTAAHQEIARLSAEKTALKEQLKNLSLIAPSDGLVVSRDVDPGTTVVAGQTVAEVIDPDTLWVNVRFDQIHAHGLAAGLPARITLRSHPGKVLSGRVFRVEPLADAVTEESLAKVVFDQIPGPFPPLGELAEITVALPPLPPAPVIPGAAVHFVDGRTGVWQVIDGDLRFTSISRGPVDLDGYLQIREGLKAGDRVVAYSENALNTRSRIHIVDHILEVDQ